MYDIESGQEMVRYTCIIIIIYLFLLLAIITFLIDVLPIGWAKKKNYHVCGKSASSNLA
jgi:hypothetical protein